MRIQKNFFTQLRFRIFFILLMSISSLALTACGGEWFRTNPLAGWFGDSGADNRAALLGDVTMFTVDMYDSYYGESDTNLTAPPVWSVKAGADVVVNLINHGAFSHNWAIVKKGATVPVPYEEGQSGNILLHGVGMVYSNSQTTITFTAPDAGEYQVICTVSGHYPLMQGRLQVTGEKVASE